ncbi:protein of unknown function [Aminobacter niigataensis]|nr:protein of unknown function [Aminobacter niigataensis]
MFHGMAELFGQLTVRHKHESDHSDLAPVMASSQPRSTLAAFAEGGSAILSTAKAFTSPNLLLATPF